MDINCIQCGEPWGACADSDMAPWQYDLFLKGAGCPGCEGEPETPFQPETISDLEYGEHEPVTRIEQFFERDNLPKWERPDDIIYWTCETCGVQVVGNIDWPKNSEFYLEYDLPHSAPGKQWYNSHPYYRGTPETTPAHSFKHENNQWIYVTSERSGGGILSYEPVTTETHICEFCLEHCHECGEPVCSLLEVDCYDVGYAACPQEYSSMRGDVFCINCLELMCSECGGLPDDCDCIRCWECGEHLANDPNDLPAVCPDCGHECQTDDDEEEEEMGDCHG